ncbi:GNAT family N-acetyltransferase [Isoptericola jiangsuensis]|uniref:GNAT family N-acetyltransferase n=1 Tax=Isoptericola jiangsuensis TaxID=548579 RepID=UPI001475EED2|nr:GNAT family N-acetyltransferase [Isoptericola jiangsuensis]
MTTTVDIDVHHDADNHRYEASVVVHGETRVVGVLRYERVDGVVTVPSTVVVPEYRGCGVAAALTAHVLDDVRAEHLLIRPECWYVAQWLDRHPEFADVVWSPDADQGTMG